MKKRLAFKGLFSFILLLSLLLTACGGTQHAGDTNASNSTEEENVPEEQVEEKEENKEEEENEQSEPQLEIVDSTGGAWKNSIDTIWVHSSAIFENTGDVPVEIGETQMNFKDTEDGMIGTSSMIYSVPRVVNPGEQAYITESTILDGITEPSDYEETTYNFSFDATEEDPNILEVSGIKEIPATDEYSTPFKVTGVVTNTTEELQDDIRIAAALLAEDDSLLGVLQGSVDVGLNAGSEAGFELSYPEVPRDIVDQVAAVEVKAYGWNW